MPIKDIDNGEVVARPLHSADEPLAQTSVDWYADHWTQLQELFHLVEAAPAEQRLSLLEISTPDVHLRARVLSLLQTTTEDGNSEVAAAGDDLPPAWRIGQYTILGHLGTGGLGSVYLAERQVGDTVQKCALKLLSRAAGAEFETRFRREQQILATLNHPNITRLLDAGVTQTHQAFLAMDYVDGLDLTRYCENHRLPVRDRLRLFLQICEVVSYAHRNLVVHLDLKPSNILVTVDGTVKLLDFGTSKLTDPEGGATVTLMGTPVYASPEQLRGEPVTTVCDVYSLGAVLFEMLSGRKPFANASTVAMMERATREQEPASLTTGLMKEAAASRGVTADRLRQLLDGDLSSIVARCLRSRARDRYSSVEALADEVQRHLTQRPVRARRQTTGYLLTKFLRRRRLAVSSAAAVLLVVGVLGTYAYMRQQQALRQGRRAEQMQTFVSTLIQLANENYTGKPAATVPEFLQLGVRILPELIKDPEDRRAAQLSLAESMYDSRDFKHALPVFQDAAQSAHAAGDAQAEAEASAFGGMCAFSLGRIPLSDEMTTRALSLAHARGVGRPARVWAEAFYGFTHISVRHDVSGNTKLLEKAVEESRSPDVPERERLTVIEKFALVRQLAGDLPDATRLAEEARTLVDREPYALCDRAGILEFQANLTSFKGDENGSLPIYRDAVKAGAACSGADSTYTLGILNMQARAMINAGQQKQAIALLEPTLPAWRREAANGPDIAVTLIYLARAYVMLGDFAQSEAHAREALQAQIADVNPASTRIAMCHLLIAQSLAGEHRLPIALAEAQTTEDIYARVPHMSVIEKFYETQAHDLLISLQTNQPIPRPR